MIPLAFTIIVSIGLILALIQIDIYRDKCKNYEATLNQVNKDLTDVLVKLKQIQMKSITTIIKSPLSEKDRRNILNQAYVQITDPEIFMKNFKDNEDFKDWLKSTPVKGLKNYLKTFTEAEMYEQCSIIKNILKKKQSHT